MKKTRHAESQILKVIRQYEAGAKTADLCRGHGISTATFYNWKSKYGGVEASELKRLKELEEENRKLKQMYANVSYGASCLKGP